MISPTSPRYTSKRGSKNALIENPTVVITETRDSKFSRDQAITPKVPTSALESDTSSYNPDRLVAEEKSMLNAATTRKSPSHWLKLQKDMKYYVLAASVAASATALDKRPKFTIWPEWNDLDVNAEKWTYPFIPGTQDAAKKEDKKGKSPTVAHAYFDDPDGKIEMPTSLRVDSWKRPQDFMMDKVPCIVDTDNVGCGFDLIANNEHLHESELLRFTISQMMTLWDLCSVPVPPDTDLSACAPGDDPGHTWRPWEHIYSLCKAGKGPHLPLYNSHGKYVVRLYWMGCWRKITVDDTIPFDEQGRMLLPQTTLTHELWPALLTKAIIKVASLDYAGGNPSQEFGDMSVTQCLTGWIPEAIPLLPSHMNQVWKLMQGSLPEWKLPEQDWEKPPATADDTAKESTPSEAPKDEKLEKDGTKSDLKDGKDKGKEKGKDGKDKDKKDDKKDKKDKGGDKDKNKGKADKLQEEKSSLDDFVLPEKPELLMFATYSSAPKHPCKVSVLGEMADASEKLRQNGLSHLYPHPVCITQTRSCPLEPPPPPVVVPSWKLIRPRKKKSPPNDEPQAEPTPPKPIQCLEITSAFVNYKVSPIPIPINTSRPKSSLERGGARSRASDSGAIEEGDENAPSPPPPKPEPEPPKEEEIPKEKPSSAKRKSSGKLSKGSAKGRRPESRQSAKGDEKTKDSPAKPAEAPAPGGPALGGGGAGGLAPPSTQALGPDGEPIPASLTDSLDSAMPEPPQDNTPKPRKAWMDFDIFCKCFRTLYVFHKSNTYLCNQYYSDLKSVTPSSSTNLGKTDKKPTQVSTAPNDGSPFYLFVDSLQPTEIVVSYSVLARWFEPPAPAPEEKKSLSQIKQGKEPKDLDKEQTNASISMDSVVAEPRPPPAVTAGTLVAEPHSWKSLVSGQPVMRLRTTGTKSAVLSLPAGRHVLKFMMTSPLGHHVHLCSTVNFVFGDEETVMAQLTNAGESCRFRDTASQVIMSLGKAIMGWKDQEALKAAMAELEKAHCPYLEDKHMSKTHHFKIFNEALYQMLKKVIKEIVSSEIVFAWRAFTLDATSKNILSMPQGSRPATGSASVRGSAKPSSKKRGNAPSLTTTADPNQADQGEAEKPENPWANREPSIEEQIAAVKVQRMWRGFFVRKLKAARTPGTEENPKVFDSLQKCWTLIEANAEENGLLLLREMFKQDPDLMTHYPFYKDEWNKISYSDYKGTFPDQPSMNWFIVFRDIFYVKEEMLLVPRLYVPIPTCMLRVIDNDTGKELPRVFQKVAPYVYKKNKRGYSFVAEARTVEQPLASNNWRMRLIGSLPGLPTPASGELGNPIFQRISRQIAVPVDVPITPTVCSTFTTKEIRDYYLPNPKNVIFRQTVKVTEDHFASLQMNTSKPDVYIKLQVLDNEEEVASATGKGHVSIPAMTFLKDITQEDIDNRRASSRASPVGDEWALHEVPHYMNEIPKTKKNSIFDDSARGAVTASDKKAEKTGSKVKRAESAVSQEPPPSRSSMRSDAELAERLEETRPHKYIIQATVMQDSWPLSESQWRFVQTLKEMEKNELKVFDDLDYDEILEKLEQAQKETRLSNSMAVMSENTFMSSKSKQEKLDRPKSGSTFMGQGFRKTVVNNALSSNIVAVKERAPSPPKPEKAPTASNSKTKQSKGGKDKGGKDKDKEANKSSRPSSQQFDITKPNWTLRVVSDAVAAEEIEVHKDTERADEIRAMKKAWEDAEPGRAAKALQSRLKYLSSHTVKLPSEEESGLDVKPSDSSGSAESDERQTPISFGDHFETEAMLTLEPPPQPQPKEALEPMDLTPFIRKTLAEPRYLDEAEAQRLLEKRQQAVGEYKAFREQVESWRSADKEARNRTKIQQLKQCQAMQNALDAARERINIPREAIRQRFLDSEQKRLEELASNEANQRAELEAKSPKGRKKSGGAVGGKKKGK